MFCRLGGRPPGGPPGGTPPGGAPGPPQRPPGPPRDPPGAPPGAPPGPPQGLFSRFLQRYRVQATGRPRGPPPGGPPGPAPGTRPPIGGAPPRGDEGQFMIVKDKKREKKRGETWCDRPQKRGKNTHKGLKLGPFWAPLQGAHPRPRSHDRASDRERPATPSCAAPLLHRSNRYVESPNDSVPTPAPLTIDNSEIAANSRKKEYSVSLPRSLAGIRLKKGGVAVLKEGENGTWILKNPGRGGINFR
jgi:hypothetical protein